MHGRQMLIAVTQMVLAELPGGIAQGPQQAGDRRILRPHPLGRAWKAHLGKPGAHGALPGDEGRAAGGAGILRVMIGEEGAFPGDPVNIGRAIAHDPHIIGRDIGPAHIIAEDHQDIRPACGRGRGRGSGRGRGRLSRRGRGLRLGQLNPSGGGGRTAQQHVAAGLSVVHGGPPSLWDGRSRRMQRKPIWLMPVSIICAWRAAGR